METPEKLNANPLVREALNRIPSSQEATFVRKSILVPKKTTLKNFQFRTYGTEYMELVLDTRRAWDAQAKLVRTERDLASVEIFGDALKTLIDAEKITEAGPEGASYIADELSILREILQLGQEYKTLVKVTTAANYAAANKDGGVVKFDAAGIIDLVLAKHQPIQDASGRAPTFLAMDAITLRIVKNNAEIKATQAAGVRVTNEVLAEIFEVGSIIEMRGVYRAKKGGAVTPIVSQKALLGVAAGSEAEAMSDMYLGRTVYQPFGAGEFDTRQTSPDINVERMIEAGIFLASEPVISNWGAAYLFENTKT